MVKYNDIKYWNKKRLWDLRKQIILGSIYIDDYINDYDISAFKVCGFFDGYTDYLQELMLEDNINDKYYFDNLSKYDNIENLQNYFYFFEECPFK